MQWNKAIAAIAILLLCENNSPSPNSLEQIALERVESVSDESIANVQALLGNLCDDQLSLFGFESSVDARNARLTSPAALLRLSVKDLLMLDSNPDWIPQDVGPERVVYLVTVGSATRAYVTLQRWDREWKIADYGPLEHAVRFAQALNRVDHPGRFLVETPDLHLQLAAARMPDGLRIGSVAPHSGLNIDLAPLPPGSLAPKINEWMQGTGYPP